MSFLDSIISPFKSLISPIASALPTIGTALGGIFGGGPAGATIGNAIGNLGSSLFGKNDNGQEAQQALNRAVPAQFQQTPVGQFGEAAGRMAGNAGSNFINSNPYTAPFSNWSVGNAGTNVGQGLSGFGQNLYNRFAPESFRQTPLGMGFSDLINKAGQTAGQSLQRGINRMTPSWASPYANTRFSSIPEQIATRGGRAFDRFSASHIPENFQRFTPGNAFSMSPSDFETQPSNYGLGAMGYAEGGPVSSFRDMMNVARYSPGIGFNYGG